MHLKTEIAIPQKNTRKRKKKKGGGGGSVHVKNMLSESSDFFEEGVFQKIPSLCVQSSSSLTPETQPD